MAGGNFAVKKKFAVVLADPPWSFRAYSEKGLGRSAEKHYPTMSREKILQIPVRKIITDQAALFLWTTYQDLDFAIKEVIPAWGFIYKTVAFIWIKIKRNFVPIIKEGFFGFDLPDKQTAIGILENCLAMSKGYYTRKQSEICLLATTEKNPVIKSHNIPDIILAEREDHSRKPYSVYERIENLFDGPYIELFGRTRRNGWDVLGLDIDGRDIFDSIYDFIEE